MYNYLLIAILLVTTAPAATCIAQSSPAQARDSYAGKGRLLPGKKGGRPGMPSRTYIDCIYAGGVIEFAANFDFESIYVVIGDESAPVLTADITPDNPCISGAYLYGEYTVTCTTDDGREFVGSICFN